MSTTSPALAIGTQNAAPAPAGPAKPLMSSFTINGQTPKADANGNIEVPKGAKIEFKIPFDAGVLGQSEAELGFNRFSTAGTPASPAASPAELKKQWSFKENVTMADGKPVPRHQMGGGRLQTITLVAPETADGNGLAIDLQKTGTPSQTLRFLTMAAEMRGPDRPAATVLPTSPAALAAQSGIAASSNGGGRPGPIPALTAPGKALGQA